MRRFSSMGFLKKFTKDRGTELINAYDKLIGI